jgi:glutamate-1-semialdehyde 2,1-aminomutase
MCFCKALGNGWNFSAITGTEALRDAASSVMYTGSYWMSAVPFAAGKACLKKLEDIKAPEYMFKLGRKLQNGLVSSGKKFGFDLKVSGHPSMWYMRIANDDSMMLHQEWVAECVKRGVFFTNHHNLFMNCAMTEEDITFTHGVAEEAFRVVKNNHPELGRS